LKDDDSDTTDNQSYMTTKKMLGPLSPAKNGRKA